MKNWLLDVVKHTKPFDFYEDQLLVVPEENKTVLVGRTGFIWMGDKDKFAKNVTVISETDKCLFEGTTEWGLVTKNLEKYLETDALGVDPVISCEYKTDKKVGLYPSSFQFSSASGAISTCHLNVYPEIATDRIKFNRNAPLPEPYLSIELSAHVLDRLASLSKLKDWSEDPFVKMYLKDGCFYVESGYLTTHNTRIVLQQDIDLKDTKKIKINFAVFNKAISVSGDKTLHFYNEDAIEIYCESYYSKWRYIVIGLCK